MTEYKYRDGSGTCLTCGGKCDIRSTRCRPCGSNAEYLVCPACKESIHRDLMTTPGGKRKTYCPPCLSKWHRNNRLIIKYGITAAEYDAMAEKQSNLCAICGGEANRDHLSVDHSHDTGKVRELLCQFCNMGLGAFKDNPELMELAAEYVRKHNV